MKRLGISTFLLILLILRWHSGLFGESVISLGDSDVKFFGAEKNDQATDASVAGDINGDGFSDLVLGAARADPEHGDSRGPAGRAYLVFGGPDLPGEVDLASLGARGIVILPGVVPGKLGTAVSDAGDFNGDGFDDFMVSAETAEYGGVVFVIFGGAPLPNPLVLSQLGAAGVTIIGRPESRFGSALANAGDFNGDGISDIVVGARKAGVPRRQKVTDTDHGHTKAGRAFIIFGGTDLPQRLNISELGNRGVVIDGIRPGDELGNSVDGAGDTNGDGFPDVVLGAERASPLGRSHAGQSYVVFGRADPPAMIDLRTLGAQGIVLHGARGGDRAGQDVAGAGDFDDDGVSDIIIGADRASPGDREHAGQAYVVFGSLEPLQEIDLKTLGSRGLVMNGVANGDKFGHSVHGIGDFNLDEVDDVIIGAERHDSRGRHKAGQVYIVFGGATPPTLLEISALGDGGIVLNAEAPGDMAGHTVADAGDVDGNSVPDVVITAKQASPLGREDAGTYYVFFGPPTPPPTDLICTRKLSENTLSWSNPTTFDAVRIDRNGVTIATLPGDATSFTDPDRIAGVLTYEVRGVRGGVPSLPVTCVLAVEVLAPFAFECVVEDGDAVLGWAHRHPVPVDGTRIFRDGMPLATVPEGQRTFRDPSPPAGPHTYAILDFLGSEESSLVECEVVVPVAPSALACAADGCDVSLSWTNNDAYSSVRVFRDGELVVVLSTGVLDAFVDRGVGVGQHAYEVQGCIGGDCSARAACGVTVLGAVVGLAGSSDGGDVTLSWTPPAAADAILVFRDMVLVADLPGIADSFVDLSVVSGTHEYEVRGRVGADLGKPSTVTVEVVDPVADLRGCANGRQIALSWRVTDVADFIEVFRDGALEAQLPGSAASLIDTVPGDGTFTYSVVAVRGNGRSSAAVTTEKVPVAPSAFEGTLANGNLDLTWVNSDAYDAIEITVNGVVQPRLPGTATSTRIAVGQLGSATVQVRGVVSAADCDNLSTPAEVTDVAVDAPFDLVCLADATDVSLRWSLGGVYDAIRVERDGVALGTVAGTATSFQDNLPGPGTFDYEVFGVINGVDTVPAACRVVVASPPASDCTIRDGRVLITWTTTEDHDSVVIERNGMAIGVLPAGVTEFVDPSPPGGVNLYGVRLTVLGSLGVPAECQVEILAPPSVVKCLADGDTVSIIWTNDAGFETIRVFRDGLEVTPVDGIAGTLRSFVDQPVPPGAFCYQIQGSTAAGTLSSLSEPCCIQVLLPPVRLTCTVFDAEVTLDWLNPRVYQRINVLRDGMVVGRLAGNAMRFTDLDSPLSPGLYTYEVRGHVDSSNSFSKSSTASCLVSIANPVTDLNCTQVGDAILLKWVPSPDADAVLIQRNGQLISTESGNASRFLDDGLTPDVYSYEVRTGSGGDVGVAVECAVEMIRAPRDLACVQDGDMVTLTWTLPDAYDTVVVRRNGAVITDPALAGTATEFVDAGLSPGIYLYEVAGTRGANTSASASCTAIIVSPVFSLACSISASQAMLTWINGTGYSQIEVLRQGPSDAAPVSVATLPGDAETFMDGPLAAAGPYTYVVIGTAGANSARGESCTATLLVPPSGLSCTTANESVSFGDVVLQWTNGEAYTSVQVYRDGSLIAELPGDATTLTDSEVARGTYDYQVIGVAGGDSSDAAICNVQVLLPPPAVTNLNCSIDGGTATLSWDGLSDLFEMIRVYRRAPGEADTTLLATLPAADMTFEDTTATEAGDYRYEVAALREGLESTRALCDIRKPFAPMDIKCRLANPGPTAGDVVISWSNPEMFASILIRRDDADVAVVPGNQTSFTDIGLAPATYNYELVATSNGSRSDASATCTVTVTPLPPPVDGLSCVINDNEATISWSNPAIYDEIEVLRRGPGEADFTSVAVLAGDATEFTDTVTEAGETTWSVVSRIAEQFNEVPALCSAVKPPSPEIGDCKLLRQTRDGGEVSISWQLPEPVDSVVVVRRREEDGEVSMVSLPGDQSSFLDTAVPAGTYVYVIVAFTGGNSSSSLPCLPPVVVPDFRGFLRGEINGDGRRDIADPIYLINNIFQGGPPPSCDDAADANDDGRLDVADSTFILNWQFRGGPEPPSPFALCDMDPTMDLLECAEFPVEFCP